MNVVPAAKFQLKEMFSLFFFSFRHVRHNNAMRQRSGQLSIASIVMIQTEFRA